MIKQALSTMTALALVATPTIASAQEANAQRIGAPVGASEELAADGILPVVIYAAILVAIGLLVFDDDDDVDFPTSP